MMDVTQGTWRRMELRVRGGMGWDGVGRKGRTRREAAHRVSGSISCVGSGTKYLTERKKSGSALATRGRERRPVARFHCEMTPTVCSIQHCAHQRQRH